MAKDTNGGGNDISGMNIKKLGFGLMRLPMAGASIDIEQVKQMVDLFMEKGFTYFDTAFGYHNGESETAARDALVKRYPRDSFLLATKMPAFAAKSAKEAEDMFWTSLERTQAGYFDFYLLHNLGGGRTAGFESFGCWDFVRRQKAEGRIRHIGFSAHATAEQLDAILAAHPETEFVQLQINYADWDNAIVQSGACYEVCRKHGKPVIVMEPVKGGTLSNLPANVAAVLEKANPGASLASWGIRYAASLEGALTVLSGMSTLAQMQDNVSFMDSFSPLTEAERAAIAKAQALFAAMPRVDCTDCKYCVPGCPARVNIPGTFKAYNDYLVFENLAAAKGGYSWETNGLNGDKASKCIECGACEAVCPQSIAIVEELKKAVAVLEA